jgi:hypothetical protein
MDEYGCRDRCNKKTQKAFQMTDEIAKIDRWNSEPLDVHTWSDHPEIKLLCEQLYSDAKIASLEPKGNRRPKRTVKESLRVLILDLYVKWLKDPSISIGFSKAHKDYKVGSRYNGLFIPRKIVEVEALLLEAGYVEELPHFKPKSGQGRSYTTRIRHTEKLRELFGKLTIGLHDIDTHANEECIILHDKYLGDNETNKKVEYKDDDLEEDKLRLVNTLRDQLKEYNNLLKRSFIDIPSYEASTFTRIIKKGPYAGRKQVISLGPDNKYVTRVFNGGLAGNWERGGRFYRGWWQQIDKEDRCKIYINDKPSLEVDFKAFHPNLLSNELGVKLPNDPYDLGELLLPEVLTSMETQRWA